MMMLAQNFLFVWQDEDFFAKLYNEEFLLDFKKVQKQ